MKETVWDEMDILEKCYECADTFLLETKQDWTGFCEAFSQIFQSNIVIYQAHFSSQSDCYSSIDLLGSTDMPLWQEYLERKLFANHIIPENQLEDLEPIRRTDHLPDDLIAEQLGPQGTYFLEHDVFYLLMVHTRLTKHTHLAFMCWRGRNEADFTDREKQRFALLMRYVLALSIGFEKSRPSLSGTFTAVAARYGLTPTETEILAALVTGSSPREIANETGRSYGTVRWHIQNILEKSQAGTQKQLMRQFYALMNSANAAPVASSRVKTHKHSEAPS